eukprot:6779306-Karenia_brevis.AAC.1
MEDDEPHQTAGPQGQADRLDGWLSGEVTSNASRGISGHLARRVHVEAGKEWMGHGRRVPA